MQIPSLPRKLNTLASLASSNENQDAFHEKLQVSYASVSTETHGTLVKVACHLPDFDRRRRFSVTGGASKLFYTNVAGRKWSAAKQGNGCGAIAGRLFVAGHLQRPCVLRWRAIPGFQREQYAGIA